MTGHPSDWLLFGPGGLFDLPQYMGVPILTSTLISCPKCHHTFDGDDKYTMQMCPNCRESFALTNTPRPGEVTRVRDPLLVERQKTHGSFEANADYWEKLCGVVPVNWNHKCPQQRLSLMMIMLKIARAISSPNVKDHWDDIAGYAKLASEACQNQ